MPKALDRCVAKVKKKGGKNPWAICTASMQKSDKLPNKGSKKRKPK